MNTICIKIYHFVILILNNVVNISKDSFIYLNYQDFHPCLNNKSEKIFTNICLKALFSLSFNQRFNKNLFGCFIHSTKLSF